MRRNQAQPWDFSGSFDASVISASYQTDWIYLLGITSGEFHLEWTDDLDAFNSRAILQAATQNDASAKYNDIGGASGGIIILNDTDGQDSQIWRFTQRPPTYIRLDFTKNDLTVGTFSWRFRGW